MVKLEQAVVVEGRYDKNALAQIVDAPVFCTNGFGVMNDPALVALLREAAEKRGLIVLTDSDAAGFVIRNYLKSCLPNDRLLHAYVPDIPGKERRKRAPGKEGKLGVEGMPPAVILQALKDAGAAICGEADRAEARPAEPITKQDLYALGLSGGSGSRQKRAALLQSLRLPEHMSANALLQALNLRFTRAEFLARFDTTEEET